MAPGITRLAGRRADLPGKKFGMEAAASITVLSFIFSNTMIFFMP
jgi:hypothetical protein